VTGEHRGAVRVVLLLAVGEVAGAHRPDAAVAGKRGHDALVERGIAGDRVDRLQCAVGRVRRDRREVAHVAFHRRRRAEAVQRVDDEVAVAQPAIAVVPVALGVRRLRDRRRHRGDDRAGVLVGIELERDRARITSACHSNGIASPRTHSSHHSVVRSIALRA
jgi:hypothetical protein